MTYSIIGTGEVGRTLASFFARADLEVALANSRGRDAVTPIAAGIGKGIKAASLEEAIAADIVFVATQFAQVREVAAAREDWGHTIVVDVTNPFNLPDALKAELGDQPSSRFNAAHLTGGVLVKAFNHLPLKRLAAPVPEGGRRAVFVAGDDAAANDTVARLAEALGFAAIQLGALDQGGRLVQPPGALVFQDLVKFD